MVTRTGSGTLSESNSCSLVFRSNESQFSWDTRVSASPRDVTLRRRMLGNTKPRQICGRAREQDPIVLRELKATRRLRLEIEAAH